MAQLLCAAAPAVSREQVLRELATNVIAAGYQQLDGKCRELARAVEQLEQVRSAESLDQARQAWSATAKAANRIRFYQAGPLVDREYASTLYYSRISPPLIEGQARSTNLLTAASLAGLGADVKSLFAIEYLLFGHKGYPGVQAPDSAIGLRLLSGPGSERRRAYLLALARDLANKAQQLAADWAAPGDDGAAAKFARGGQASLNLLINQLARSLEDAGANHLYLALVLPAPLGPQLYRIEGSPSGSSLPNLAAYLEGAYSVCCPASGHGVADLHKPLNAPLAARVQQQFEAAISATKSIGEPLDQALADKRSAVQEASDKVHQLEILLKVDVASALGVTITVLSSDGD